MIKMMPEPIGVPACFSSPSTTEHEPATLTRTSSGSPQSLIMSIYRAKIGPKARLVTISWCKNLLLHGLSISVDGPNGHDHYHCKVELKPWYFWKKQGSKQFFVEGRNIGIVWDLKGAKFHGEVEPVSDYYVALVCDEEVVLVVGDMKKDAFRKTGCRPCLVDPVLVSRKEHVFGKKRFSTKVKFHERGKCHEITVECNNNGNCHGNNFEGVSPEMDIKIDGELGTQVKHLQWKFRGNEVIEVNNEIKLEVYWDVHDWLFGSGPRHAMFLFKSLGSLPLSSSPSSSSSSPMSTSCHVDDQVDIEFSLFLYAWKVE